MFLVKVYSNKRSFDHPTKWGWSKAPRQKRRTNQRLAGHIVLRPLATFGKAANTVPAITRTRKRALVVGFVFYIFLFLLAHESNFLRTRTRPRFTDEACQVKSWAQTVIV